MPLTCTLLVFPVEAEPLCLWRYNNLPVIGFHLNEIPHISGWDDVAFEKLGISVSSIDEFTKNLDAMIMDSPSYRHNAILVRESIEREHCSPGWNVYLNNILQIAAFPNITLENLRKLSHRKILLTTTSLTSILKCSPTSYLSFLLFDLSASTPSTFQKPR